jgi:rhodanese-related sulfurtransferase
MRAGGKVARFASAFTPWMPPRHRLLYFGPFCDRLARFHPRRGNARGSRMNQLLEYARQNPMLLSAAVVLALFASALEVRHRMSGSSGISPNEAVGLLNLGGVLLLDVRSAADYEAGHITDARSAPAGELQGKLADTVKKYKEKPVLVYCETGAASGNTAQALRTQGFTKVVTLRGGLQSWRQENMPLVKSTPVKRKDGKAA